MTNTMALNTLEDINSQQNKKKPSNHVEIVERASINDNCSWFRFFFGEREFFSSLHGVVLFWKRFVLILRLNPLTIGPRIYFYSSVSYN